MSEILIRVDKDGVHVVSEKIAEKLAKKKLSASLITGLKDGCPAGWITDQYVVNEIIPEEPDNAARRGSMFHQLMENFFALPVKERSKGSMKLLVKEILESDEYKDLGQIKEAVQWLKAAVNGYYNMGGSPENVEIATLEKDGKEKSGIEYFVSGRIGTTKREILGFIDRVIVDPTREDGAVVIEDWKSGKVKKFNPKTKDDTGFSEQRQQIIYSELLRQEGHEVSGARLIFPIHKEVVNVFLDDPKLYDRVINDIEETDKKLDHCIENNTFEYNPTFLCHWCPLFNGCPSAVRKSPYDKPRLAADSQPSIDILAKAVEFG